MFKILKIHSFLQNFIEKIVSIKIQASKNYVKTYNVDEIIYYMILCYLHIFMMMLRHQQKFKELPLLL